MLKLEDFPNCCGIQVLIDLDIDEEGSYYDDDRDVLRKPSPYEIVGMLKEAILTSKSNNKGKLFAVSSEDQQAIRPYLRKFGFKAIERFNNPNTGAFLTMWRLNLWGLTKDTLEKRGLRAIKHVTRKR